MPSESGLLWPRHEVLQLVSPAIPQSGRYLSQGLTVETVRQLAKMQSQDGSISFHQWYTVARDLLKWNENFIRLFWDMLHMAMWYQQKSEWSQHCDFVQFGYLVVFLVMHIPTATRSSSPTRGIHAFECIWPPSDNGNSGNVASPPTSPVLSHRKGASSSSAPLSPRGGNSSPRKQMSPRLNTTSCYMRSHTQNLSVLREKIPFLLYALSIQDSVTAEHMDEKSDLEKDISIVTHNNSDERSSRREDSPLFLATMSPSAFDALSLVVGGGITKTQEVGLLSFFYESCEEHSRSSGTKSNSSLIQCPLVADWMSDKLKLNDIVYPPSPIVGNSSPTSSGNGSPHSPGADISVIHNPNAISEFSSPPSPTSGNGGANTMCETFSSPPLQHGQPIRQVIPIDTPQCRNPTVFHGSNCSAFYLLKVHGNGNSNVDDMDHVHSTKSLGHMDDDDNELLLLDDNDDVTNAVQGKGIHHKNVDAQHNSLSPDRYGPVLLSGCSRTNLYLLSPYTFATVSSCADSEIVMGSVAGVVVVSGCERIQLTVACRKLILWNCHDCDIRVAALTPTIVSGDCRGLTFGPFNTTYRHLRCHLRLAHLDSLIVASKSTLSNVGSNCWNEIYDVNTCADLDPPTPRDRSSSDDYTSGGVDLFGSHKHSNSMHQLHSYPMLSSGLSSLPPPPDSVLTILNPEKYSFLPIPYTSEFQPQEMCPMMTPETYLEAYMRKKQASVSVRQGIQASIHQRKMEKNIDCEGTFNQMLSHQFLEWLAQSGKAPALLDLIRLDADEKGKENETTETSRDYSGTGFSNNSW